MRRRKNEDNSAMERTLVEVSCTEAEAARDIMQRNDLQRIQEESETQELPKQEQVVAVALNSGSPVSTALSPGLPNRACRQ